MIPSIKTKQRLIDRALKHEHYHSVQMGNEVWLCETEKKLIARSNGYSQIVPTTRLVTALENHDNIWGIRHVRQTRAWAKLNAEWQRRQALPKASRQQEADEASAEFQQKFSEWSARQGLFGTLTL